MTARATAGAVTAAIAALSFAPSLAHGQPPAPTPDPTATPRGVVAPGATVQRLAGGFQFTEGPAADGRGDVFFSDVRASRILRWSAADGAVTTHREGAAGTNGLYFDGLSRLVVCESGARRVVREELDGSIAVLADAYDGKRLNSPNDVFVHPAGHVYFTDPRYGAAADVEQDGMHVYVIPADGGPPRRVAADLRQPNGLIGPPDGRTLYITDPGGGANKTWRYRIEPDGTLADKTEFASVGGDGMAIDEHGNVYLATGGAVRVFAEGGAPLQDIAVPEAPSNMAFGGPDHRTLYITARTGLYAVRMAVRGADGPYAWAGDAPTPPPSEPTAQAVTPTPTTIATAPPSPTAPAPQPAPRLYLPWASSGPLGAPSSSSAPVVRMGRAGARRAQAGGPVLGGV